MPVLEMLISRFPLSTLRPHGPFPTTTLPQNLTPKRCFASSKLASASGPRIITSTPEKMIWSSGAMEMSSCVNASSSRTFPTLPDKLGLSRRFTASFTRSSDEEMTKTWAPTSRRASAAPNPILENQCQHWICPDKTRWPGLQSSK